MSKLFNKLNLKDQKEILVLNHPGFFDAELDKLPNIRILRDLKEVDSIDFALAFVQSIEEIERMTEYISGKVLGDPVIWFAYPKKTSKKYAVDINRDQGWNALKKAGFKPVRQVAIDEDWSAIRFRRIERIGK